MGDTRATSRTFALALAITATALPAAVSADEIFLCDDARILKVALQDLEWMKQNDPCVASHYGLKARAAMVPPLPQRTPTRTTANAAKQPNFIAKTGRIETAAINTPAAADQARPAIPAFRKVRIINAGKGAPRFFHHRH